MNWLGKVDENENMFTGVGRRSRRAFPGPRIRLHCLWTFNGGTTKAPQERRSPVLSLSRSVLHSNQPPVLLRPTIFHHRRIE